MSAVHDQLGAGYAAGLIAGQIQNALGNVLRSGDIRRKRIEEDDVRLHAGPLAGDLLPGPCSRALIRKER